jgi:hypothetical protein
VILAAPEELVDCPEESECSYKLKRERHACKTNTAKTVSFAKTALQNELLPKGIKPST